MKLPLVPVLVSVAIFGAGVASASTIHRYAVTQLTGSGGATAFVQNAAGNSALQGEVNTSGANTSIKIPFGVLGEYDATGSMFGIGVAGISTTGYGIAAESFSSNPSLIALNSSTGDGVDAFTAGSGGANLRAAVYGEADGTGAGVEGLSKGANAGGYFSASGSGPGTVGTSASSYGVEGFTSTGNASQSAGFFNGQQHAPGIYAETFGPVDAVIAAGPGGNIGVLGDSVGEGVVGYGGAAGYGAVAAIDMHSGAQLISGYAYNGGSPALSFFVDGGSIDRSNLTNTSSGSDVQISGDVFVTGRVYEACANFPASSGTSCEPVSHDATGTGPGTSAYHSAGGADVAMYHGGESSPTVEDEGTAHLSAGRAYVRLDPAFAKTMAMDRPYRVFLTPNGDSRGLFVTGRTPQGFTVSENMHGNSTLDFDYRIVGAPFGDRSARLAVSRAPVAAAGRPGDAHVNAELKRFAAMQAAAPKAPASEAAARVRPANFATKPGR